MDTKHIATESLPIRRVDANSPVPLYHQVEMQLRDMIQAGTLAPGDILPPEVELSNAYGVGRHTMRMALGRLAADDLITRKAGRGTVVKQRTDRLRFSLDRSFTQQMAEMGRTAHSQVLGMSRGVIDASAPTALQSRLGAPCLVLVRLRFGDDEPIGIQATTVITEHCPDLDRHDFAKASLYDVLAREYNLLITKIAHSVGARLADEGQASLLEISPDDPLLVFNTTAFLENGEAIEHTMSYYRADRYEYTTVDMYNPC